MFLLLPPVYLSQPQVRLVPCFPNQRRLSRVSHFVNIDGQLQERKRERIPDRGIEKYLLLLKCSRVLRARVRSLRNFIFAGTYQPHPDHFNGVEHLKQRECE